MTRMTKAIAGELDARGMRIHTTVLFRYDPDDPLAVSLQYQRGTLWFARDLLAGGMRRMTGEDHGSILIVPFENEIEIIQKRKNIAGLTFVFPTRTLRDCLAETYRMVPLGNELVEVPGDLSGLGVES